MTKQQRILAPVQLAYITARATYEELTEAAAAILGECTAETVTEVEAFCEREAQVHTELGTLRARIALRDTEQALLDWGVAYAKTAKGYKPEYQDMFERMATTPLLKYRHRAIDLFMKLDVSPIIEKKAS